MRLARRRREREGWTDEHKAALLGHDFFNVFREARFLVAAYKAEYADHDQEAEALRAEAWHDLRDELLPIWIADKPFSRPDIWWKCDAPELRRCVNGVHPFERPDFISHCAECEQQHPGYTNRMKKTWFGKPCIFGAPGLDGKAEYETERDYLERHNLLTPTELALIESPHLE